MNSGTATTDPVVTEPVVTEPIVTEPGTTPDTEPDTSKDSEYQANRLEIGAVIGIAAGAIALIGLAAASLYLFVFRKKGF